MLSAYPNFCLALERESGERGAKVIKAVMAVNTRGKPRLAKCYKYLDSCLVYKHFVTLYFVLVFDSSENELAELDLIQDKKTFHKAEASHFDGFCDDLKLHSVQIHLFVEYILLYEHLLNTIKLIFMCTGTTAMVGRNGPLECRCFILIDEYAPEFRSSIIGYDMLTPPDLDREIGLTGRNIIHGAMGFDSLFLMRPVQRTGNRIASFSVFFMRMSVRYQAFTCAAEVLILRVLRSGVMGASGRNAAQLVQDFNKKWDTKLHFFIMFWEIYPLIYLLRVIINILLYKIF
ncbi:AP complex [Theobroma cacao]|nr:AP complex [Theobroma cacao]